MAIKIIDQPDIRLTAGDLARYRREYDDAMRYYAGPLPTLEEFIRGRQANDARTLAMARGEG